MKTYKCGCYGEVFQFCSLHAAAPELLEACKLVLYFLKDCTERPRSSFSTSRIGSDAEDFLCLMQAAIAKAERED